MLSYLHFTLGDIVWFYGWVPESKGAMVGTCIGLFLLGLIDRWIMACASVMENYWDKRMQILQSHGHSVTSLSLTNSVSNRSLSGSGSGDNLVASPFRRFWPPSVPSHDLLRGIVHIGRSALQFALMLGVMTFNVGLIMSILLGLGAGEMLFGRFAA